MRSPIWLSHVAGALLCAVLPAGAQQAANSQPRQRHVITAEEIERLNAVEDAYQVVLRLRPEFLRAKPRAQLRSPGATEHPAGQPGGETASGSDAYSPQFDVERSGRATANADGPVGFATGARTVSGTAPMATPVEQGRDSVLVYIDHLAAGGPEELTTIPARDVQEIRWLRPADAQQRFGMRHRGTVIAVMLQH
jgi:hypothetical protein